MQTDRFDPKDESCKTCDGGEDCWKRSGQFYPQICRSCTCRNCTRNTCYKLRGCGNTGKK